MQPEHKEEEMILDEKTSSVMKEKIALQTQR
jgi:hypothetical protein